jgi:ubiquitin carboxyl-terminal hydrolase 5/13
VDRYNIDTSVICYECSQHDVDKTIGNLSVVIEGVMTAMTFSKREEVKAWEQEFVPCEHTLCLVQQESPQAAAKGIYRYFNSLTTVLNGE